MLGHLRRSSIALTHSLACNKTWIIFCIITSSEKWEIMDTRGSTLGPNLTLSSPFRSTTNLVKFHLMALEKRAVLKLLVLYTGSWTIHKSSITKCMDRLTNFFYIEIGTKHSNKILLDSDINSLSSMKLQTQNHIAIDQVHITSFPIHM